VNAVCIIMQVFEEIVLRKSSGAEESATSNRERRAANSADPSAAIAYQFPVHQSHPCFPRCIQNELPGEVRGGNSSRRE